MIPGESVSEEVGMELAAVIADRIFRGRGERLVEMMYWIGIEAKAEI